MIMSAASRRWGLRSARLAVAGVWAYEGLWCKLLGRDADQRRIVALVPGVGELHVPLALAAIGAAETALAAWVLAGRARRAAATAQTVAVVVMNTGGLGWARAQVPHPGRLLAQTAVFVTLVWIAAEEHRWVVTST
jgi:hypothetical protein